MTLSESIINGLLKFLTTVLPLSPFRSFINACGNIPWLGVVNYFVPIGTFISILTAWVTAMVLLYLYAIIMRWIKVLGE